MSGFSVFFLHLCVLGCAFDASLAWSVGLPSRIKGLLGSCLVIPCSFDYTLYPPQRPDRVVWYQYSFIGYPLASDNWHPLDVIPLFRGRTSVLASHKKCTLQIEPVMWSDNGQELYPWVDPDHIGESTYIFSDKTVTIEVVDRAENPQITITGDMKVGKSVTVQCSVFHTCSTNPPTLSLNIPLKDAKIKHTDMKYGTKTTLTTTFIVQRDHQTVECSVRHPGGQTAKYSKPFDAKCSFSPLIISSASNEFLEGIASPVTCTASYMCAHHLPVLTWNYDGMPASTHTTKVQLNGVTSWKIVSTLTLTSSAEDHGKALTCYAQFTEGNSQQASITLRVKRNMHSLGWSISTPRSITGLRGSCIVIPCTFSYTDTPPPGLQIIWYLYQSSGYPVVFNPEKRNVVSEFNGITSVIGVVANHNCSLKIDNLKTSHNEDLLYPWIDKNPIDHYHSQGHSLYDKTTQLMVEEQLRVVMAAVSGSADVGQVVDASVTRDHNLTS